MTSAEREAAASTASPASTEGAAPPRRPRPNAERRQEARARLLLAAVDMLVEKGYAATTVANVQERAGASRGAMLHYFPTKSQLLVDAVEYLADAQIEELNRRAAPFVAEGGGGSFEERVQTWLDLVWSCFASRLFHAVLELWIASRTEPGLREHLIPYERRLGNSLRELFLHMFPGPVQATEFRAVYDATLVYYRGLALSELLGIRGAEQHELRRIWDTLISERMQA